MCDIQYDKEHAVDVARLHHIVASGSSNIQNSAAQDATVNEVVGVEQDARTKFEYRPRADGGQCGGCRARPEGVVLRASE